MGCPRRSIWRPSRPGGWHPAILLQRPVADYAVRVGRLLFCKKEAKNFFPFGARGLTAARQTRKVFLLLFLQKKKALLLLVLQMNA
jgi:hypothetical protein